MARRRAHRGGRADHRDPGHGARRRLTPPGPATPGRVATRPGVAIATTLVGILQATPAGTRFSYDISVDGTVVTHWEKELLGGGRFVLEGGRYLVGVNRLGTRYTLTDRNGATVATASNPNRRRWTIVAGDQVYEFRRPGPRWRQHYDLVVGEQVAGVMRRSGRRAVAVAELPTVPLVIQIFAVVVALASWDALAIFLLPALTP